MAVETRPPSSQAATAPPEPAQEFTPNEGFQERLRSLQLPANERRPARKGGMPRWLVVVFLLLLAGGGYAVFAAYEQYQVGDLPEVEAVTFGEDAASNLILDLNGYVVPRTMIKIAPRVGGMIVSLPIEVGTKVEKGDLLTQIDDTSFKVDLLETEAALDLAEANLSELKAGALPEEIQQARENAKLAELEADFQAEELKRAESLFRSGGIPRSDFDRMQSTHEKAKAQVLIQKHNLKLLEGGTRKERLVAAEADVARAKAAVERVKIFIKDSRLEAPISGTILEKQSEVGEIIRPEGGVSHLCVLADLSQMEAEVDMQERDLSKVKPGQPCQVIPDAYADRVYDAKIDRIQPSVNRQRGVVTVNIAILEPDEHLLPQMNCRVLFLRESKESKKLEKPKLPVKAILKEGDKTTVYVLVEGAVERRVVETGAPSGEDIEILSGIENGEIVLLPGDKKIEVGKPVRPRLKKEKEATS